MTAPGAVLSRREGRLQVIFEGTRLADVGTVNLEAVVLWGANATIPALRLLLGKQIPLVLLDARGRYRGRLEPRWGGHVLLRDRQRGASPEQRLEFARELVAAKLANQAMVLDRWSRRGARGLSQTVRRLREWSSEAYGARDLGPLRGLEGTAAREYFAAVARALPGGFGRSRRPPRDVTNAVLSAAYGILLERCLAAATTAGFDPYAGFYHGRKFGRPALALDLMEPLRPAVDRVIFGAARRRELGAHLAQQQGDGCRLTQDGFRLVLTKVSSALRRRVPYRGATWPLGMIPIEQSRALARALLTGQSFEAFRLPRD